MAAPSVSPPAGGVSPPAAPWFTFVLMDLFHMKSLDEVRIVTEELVEGYQADFIQYIDIAHLFHTPSGADIVRVADDDGFIMLDSETRIISVGAVEKSHVFLKTVFWVYRTPKARNICVLACHQIEDRLWLPQQRRDFLKSMLDETSGFDRWMAMGRFGCSRELLDEYFGHHRAQIEGWAGMYCISVGLPRCSVLALQRKQPLHLVLAVEKNASDASQLAEASEPLEAAARCGAKRRRTADASEDVDLMIRSQTILNALPQLPDDESVEFLLRSLYDHGGAKDMSSSKTFLAWRAKRCLKILTEARNSVMEETPGRQQRNMLDDEEMDMALANLKEEWLLRFAHNGTRTAIYKLQEEIEANKLPVRHRKQTLHNMKRRNFSAWLHRLSGNDHIGYALLRCGPSLDHMVRLTEAHHKLRKEEEDRKQDPEDELLPKRHRNQVLINIAGIR